MYHTSSNNCVVKMLIALVLFLQFCGGEAGVARSISEAKFNIAGGKTINITDAPYQVNIIWKEKAGCTGVLLAADVVISSGHCLSLSRNNPSDYKVRAGSDHIDKDGEYVEGKKILIHPGSNLKSFDYNIGLLWLPKKLPLSEKIGTIEMLNQGEEIEDGESVFVSGWGAESETGKYSTNLQRVEVKTSNFTLCSDRWKKIFPLTPRMMCTFREGSGFCVGDWGAPLVYKGKLAGVANLFVNKCGDAEFPQLSAKVSSMRDWIDEAMKKNTIYN